jgi:hypothetical protein
MTRSKSSTTILPAFLLSILLLNVSSAWAVRPIAANIAVVAGGEVHAGYKDGSFTTALFNKPLGLAVSADGSLLYVADSGNHRIRVIHLDQNNEVTTLAGQDSAGRLDGPLAVAQFNQPRGLLYLPGDRLLVHDSENLLLRLVDLKAGTVTTLAGGSSYLGKDAASGSMILSTGPATQVSLKGLRDMAYLPAADALFFTQPELGVLKRLDLKTNLVSIVLEKNEQIPHPAALACQDKKIYLADQDGTQVYSMEWKEKEAGSPAPVASAQAKVLSISLNGGILYTLLETPGVPPQRFFLNGLYKGEFNDQFNNRLVTFRSPWGDTLPPEALFPPRENSFAPGTGFAADPGDIRKFYVARPDYHMVVSYRDLFGFEWNPQAGDKNSNGLDEPEYPAKKPKNTYRVIIVGDSRSAEVQDYAFDADYHKKRLNFFPHHLSLAPQIERELNFKAALDGTPLNYEVFNVSKHGEFLIWPTFELPDVVKRNDIDLVVILMPRSPTDFFPYQSYFDHPLTADGIPKYPNDMEYMLKPPLERIPKGTPKAFYDYCKAHDMVRVEKSKLDFDVKLFADPGIRDMLLELYGKPLDVLNKKLSTMRTSGGEPVKLVLCTLFTGRSWEKHFDIPVWVDAAKKFGLPLLDLNEEMNALHLSFFPLTGDSTHLNADGCVFYGRLLAHDLIRDKFIPWKAEAKEEPAPAVKPKSDRPRKTK